MMMLLLLLLLLLMTLKKAVAVVGVVVIVIGRRRRSSRHLSIVVFDAVGRSGRYDAGLDGGSLGAGKGRQLVDAAASFEEDNADAGGAGDENQRQPIAKSQFRPDLVLAL